MQDILLGAFLVSCREHAGLSIFEVPKMAEIPGKRILELESGKPKVSIKYFEAQRLAMLYDVPIHNILRFVGSEDFDGPTAS